MVSNAERTTLRAVLERLIPSDARGPGAVEAGVLDFVERRYEEHRDVYAPGLAALGGFATLTMAEQNAELSRLEASGSPFFELVRLHAIQGMFGDPSHGGNAGSVGWDLIGFPGPKVVFTVDDQSLDVDVERLR
jgi:gluconate 2-dehydrogenase gamma chain